MPFGLYIPTYSRKDCMAIVACTLSFALLSGYILYGSLYLESLGSFTGITFLLFTVNCFNFLTYSFAGFWLRKRFPLDQQMTQRVTLTIGLYLMISAAFLNLNLRWLDQSQIFSYRVQEDHFWKLFAALGTLNVALTFLHESIIFFNRFKAVTIETQSLKKEYTRSRLLGLQSQVSPHFLFNNLNTLSSLIQEDPEKAEVYLNELSKVYRHLLRNNEVQLVPLQTEACYLCSYIYLLQQRHGSGLQLNINISELQQQLLIPPQTLQMIVENIVNNNTLSKSAPLIITIRSSEGNWLEVSNNDQPRVGSEAGPLDEGLDNIIKKIHLLCRCDVSIATSGTERLVKIPLINVREDVAI